MRLLKRRNTTTGLSIEDKVKAWSMMFYCNSAYFSALKKIGFDQRTCEKAELLAKPLETWNRLGPSFLASWIPTPSRQIPWAVEQFGDPG